jgi:hypothetical protein
MGVVQALDAETAAGADISSRAGLMQHPGGIGEMGGMEMGEIDSMAADQQLKELSKELHDLKAARDEPAIFHTRCPDAFLFRKTHHPKEDS